MIYLFFGGPKKVDHKLVFFFQLPHGEGNCKTIERQMVPTALLQKLVGEIFLILGREFCGIF